jgi:5-methyltetrahydrofolate--homocysteine methyltransferase
VSLAAARANKLQLDWANYTPPKPKFVGRRVFKNFDLAELAKYIDWAPFFQTWDLAGPFPEILKDQIVGEEAVRVFSDGKRMLQRIIEGRWLTANGVMAIYPANQINDDDIALWADESRATPALVWHGLRQQTEKPVDTAEDGTPVARPNLALADFVAPKSIATNVHGTPANPQKDAKNAVVNDFVGCFAVTAGIGADEKAQAFVRDLDDYSAILLKALADRLAEAFAECLHQRVRQDLWGYAADEGLSNEDLIGEKYQGIRPAPGYPACPDHSVKRAMFDVLRADEIGMGLTESLAMTPAASVSGFYLSHPDARYFVVGRIGEDQAKDVAQRSAADETLVMRALAPNLG